MTPWSLSKWSPHSLTRGERPRRIGLRDWSLIYRVAASSSLPALFLLAACSRCPLPTLRRCLVTADSLHAAVIRAEFAIQGSSVFFGHPCPALRLDRYATTTRFRLIVWVGTRQRWSTSMASATVNCRSRSTATCPLPSTLRATARWFSRLERGLAIQTFFF